MAVLTICNNKGGSAKTTSAIIIGTVSAKKGNKVVMLGGDASTQSLSHWENSGPLPDNVQVVHNVNESNINMLIDKYEASNDLLIIDMEGIASKKLALGIARSNFVLVPINPKYLDVKVASQTLNLIRELEHKTGRAIPHAVAFTRTKNWPTREEKAIRAKLEKGGVTVLGSVLPERNIYSHFFRDGGDLYSMDDADNAIEFAEKFTLETVKLATQ